MRTSMLHAIGHRRGCRAVSAACRRCRCRRGRFRRRHLGQSLAVPCRRQERLFRRRQHQDRSRLRAVERVGDPAARCRFLCDGAHRRHGRSDPRHRQRRAGRLGAHRHPGAALCAIGQARDQEDRRFARQDHHHRRRQRYHPHLHRAHVAAARPEIRRLRLRVCRRHQRAVRGVEIRRGRCSAAHRAVQFLRRVRRASPISASPSIICPTCRSPAWRSTATGRRPIPTC